MNTGERDIFKLSKARLRENAKFRALTPSEKWFWIDLFLFLDDQAERGVCRWPLDRIARSLGAPLEVYKSLVEQDVLRGSNAGETCKPFIHKDRWGKEHPLIPAQMGPIWYSSACVRDDYLRAVASQSGRRGGGNPLLKGVLDHTYKGIDKGGVKGAVKGVTQTPPQGSPPHTPPLLHPPATSSLGDIAPAIFAGSRAGEQLPPIPKSLNTPEFCAAWADWIEHRRQRRPKVTPLSATRTFNILEPMGPTRAIAAINFSIAQGYQGIVEPRQNQNLFNQRGNNGNHESSRAGIDRQNFSGSRRSIPELNAGAKTTS